MVLLGKNPGIVQKNANVHLTAETETEEYLLASALQKANIESKIPMEYYGESNCDQNIEVSSDTSSSSSMSNSLKNTSEKDGIVYLAGYLARKYKKEFPELGTYTHENEAKTMHTYAMPSWACHLEV